MTDRYRRSNDLPWLAIVDAQSVVNAVREHGPEAMEEMLTGLSRNDLYALAVTLAAMLPDNYTPAELLAWNDHRYYEPPTPVETTQAPLFPAISVIWRGQPLRPHGTHAAFVRHRKNREEPCDSCWHGERDYQRERKRRNRALERLEVSA